MSAALLFLRTFWEPLAEALALLLALWALHHYGQTRYEAGEAARQAVWDEANRKARAAADKKEADDKKAIAEKTEPIKEKRDEDLKQNDGVRADVGTGKRIVYVRAACPRSDLPSSPAPSGVDDGKAAQLDPTSGQTVLDLRAQLLKTEAALAALQEWARVTAPAMP